MVRAFSFCRKAEREEEEEEEELRRCLEVD
jgi:hypothetical protein